MSAMKTDVLEFVREQLARAPDTGSADLFAEARKQFRSIRQLTLQQFHGRYVLTIMRERAQGRKHTKRGRAPAATSRKSSPASDRKQLSPAPDRAEGATREVLLSFANEVAKAETKADLIKVLGAIDHWVDRTVAAASQA